LFSIERIVFTVYFSLWINNYSRGGILPVLLKDLPLLEVFRVSVQWVWCGGDSGVANF